MLSITCPLCGPRAEIEFRYGGESHIQRPGPPAAVSDAAWADYLYNRSNAKGVHYERWLHAAGCRRWFNVARDTVSHEVVATYGMGETGPAARGAGSPAGGPAMTPGVAQGGAS